MSPEKIDPVQSAICTKLAKCDPMSSIFVFSDHSEVRVFRGFKETLES